MDIVELDEGHRGRKIVFEYETDRHYRAEVTETADGFGVAFREEPLPKAVAKRFTGVLLEPWLEKPRLFGARHNDEFVAFLEVSHESWNNRLRVNNLWVRKDYRCSGIGRRLLEQAAECARTAGARALVLETQSCNCPAIRFYRACGFRFVGCDVAAYTNDDPARCEVRIELGRTLASCHG